VSSERLRIVVAGYVVRGPLGGMAWHHLQYVLGLVQLGHDVLFVEDSDDYESCWDPERERLGTDASFGLRFATDAFGRLGLGDRWAYHDAHRGRWAGPRAAGAERTSREADLLLDVSGINPIRPWLEAIPARALIDTDPVFTQVRHLADESARAQALGHTAFFTFAENFGLEDCTVPDDGLPWQPTRQPVVLDAWPVTAGPRDGPFTTVMQWESYRAVEHAGTRYAVKAASFEPYADLPHATTEVLELALGSAGAPREDLRRRGWRIRHPYDATRDPWVFQQYVQHSKGEWSVAKHGYAVTRSGWFSERSAGYLASGRPVVVQDTGFGNRLETGCGLLAFSTPDEARAALEDVDARYEEHCRAARELCAARFDAHDVLTSLIERAVR